MKTRLLFVGRIKINVARSADARSMLEEIRASKILNGVRGALPTDKNALARLMLGISALCTAFPEIAELDLNPVLAYPQGVGIPDARILLEGDNSRGHGEAQRTGIDRHVATP